MRTKIYLGLVHYPVYNKKKETVCTSVTNFDIHDISRSCKTYNLAGYSIIIPLDAQKEITERVLGYWQDGFGGAHNKDREEAFSITSTTASLEEAIAKIEAKEGKRPKIITTSAHTFPNSITYPNLSKQIMEDEEVYFLLFGTGWGLTEEIMDMSDHILEPIRGNTEYNHLSVRSAVAIILDRLLGEN